MLDLFDEFKALVGALEANGIDGLIALKSLRNSGQDLDDIELLRDDDDES